MVGYLNVTYSLLNDAGEVIKDFPVMKNIANRMIIFYSDKEELSGEKQKISIARALLKDTPILILDEPSNHLDEQSLIWLGDFIKRTNKTVLLISHQDKLSDLATVKVTI